MFSLAPPGEQKYSSPIDFIFYGLMGDSFQLKFSSQNCQKSTSTIWFFYLSIGMNAEERGKKTVEGKSSVTIDRRDG